MDHQDGPPSFGKPSAPGILALSSTQIGLVVTLAAVVVRKKGSSPDELVKESTRTGVSAGHGTLSADGWIFQP